MTTSQVRALSIQNKDHTQHLLNPSFRKWGAPEREKLEAENLKIGEYNSQSMPCVLCYENIRMPQYCKIWQRYWITLFYYLSIYLSKNQPWNAPPLKPKLLWAPNSPYSLTVSSWAVSELQSPVRTGIFYYYGLTARSPDPAPPNTYVKALKPCVMILAGGTLGAMKFRWFHEGQGSCLMRGLVSL